MTDRSSKRKVSVLRALALSASLLSGCAKDFSGPYACNEDFESCTTTNECETNVATDPEHCGSCGTACPQGAVCTDKECSAAPPELATGVNTTTLTMNGENFYWSSQNINGVEGLRKSDATEFTIATPGANQSNNMPFAVDDAEVFYFQFMNSGNGPEARLTAVPALSGTPASVRQVGTLQTQSLNAQMLAVSGDSVFSSFDTSNGGPNNPLSIFSVPKAGGTLSPVAMFTNWGNGFVVDSSNVYTTGSCEIDRAPASGGSVSTLASAPDLGCPAVFTSDGTTVFLAASFTQYPNDSNGSNNGNSQPQCVFNVAGVPLGGGRPMRLASMHMDEPAIRIAVDDSSVYVATQKSVWRVAKTGGSLARVAGNLGATLDSQGPNNSGSGCTTAGSGGSYPVALAVDASNIYVGVTTNGQGASLFKIAK